MKLWGAYQASPFNPYITKRWLTTFTVDDLIDAYMIFFQGNL